MDLRSLQCFVAVAEELNFRRAAVRLRMAQPPLSGRIKALERRLEVRLFDRTTRSVTLTAAGRALLDEARNLLTSATQAEARTRAAEHGLAGVLRIGVNAPSANDRLAAVLRNFRRAYPAVRLEVSEAVSSDQLARLMAGDLDAGFLRPPIGFPELAHEFIEESKQILAAPAGHRLARKRTLAWADFDSEDLVLIHPNIQHGFYDSFLAACAAAGAAPRAAQYAFDIQTKMWLISAGFGVAPTAETIAEIKRPGLVFRPLPTELPRVATALVWRRSNHAPGLTAFIDLARRPAESQPTAAD